MTTMRVTERGSTDSVVMCDVRPDGIYRLTVLLFMSGPYSGRHICECDWSTRYRNGRCAHIEAALAHLYAGDKP